MTGRSLAILVVLAGCPAPEDTTTSTTDVDPSTSDGTTVATIPPTTTESPPTTTDVTTTDATTTDATTTEVTTTGDPTTGGPSPGGARVMYSLVGAMPGQSGALRLVDDTLPDGPAAPVTVLDPPAGGFLGDTTIAPSGARMIIAAEEADATPRLFVLDRFTLAVTEAMLPADMTWFGDVTFAPDEQMIAFAAAVADGPPELYLCPFTPEGTCIPEVWSPPPAMGGNGSSGHYAFSDDGAKIAFTADPTGQGGVSLLVGEVDVPGIAVELAAFMPVFTDIGALRFSLAGDVLYFSVDEQVNAVYVTYAVDLSTDPPGPPVPLNPPVMTDVMGRIAPDRSALMWWTGDGLRGDLNLIPIEGASPGMATLLNSDGPGRAFARWFWSPDSQRVTYRSDHMQQANSDDLYVVEVGGPEPGAPVRVNAPIGPGGSVNDMAFTADSQRLVYFASEADAGDELFIADLAAPGAAVKVSAPLPDGGTIQTTHWFSPDESKIVYLGTQETVDVNDLFLVDLSGPQPSAPVNISPPLPPGEVTSFWDPTFAPDGARVYIITPRIDGQRRLIRVSAEGALDPVTLSLDQEAVGYADVLPPAP
jgi:hypothetical protein